MNFGFFESYIQHLPQEAFPDPSKSPLQRRKIHTILKSQVLGLVSPYSPEHCPKRFQEASGDIYELKNQRVRYRVRNATETEVRQGRDRDREEGQRRKWMSEGWPGD